MTARIYRKPKSAGQSGQAGTHDWILEYGQSVPHRPTPLMGWTGSQHDTQSQLRLRFPNEESAVAYANRYAIAYEVERPVARIRKAKVYADNFAANRIQNWTH
ncbi:ETC complex I subunit [Acetobacter estunensis]|uniref:ETC complex I subunit n=1 Tax=Acetobacter estunensis TaxID=104097 RepID=UPI001C2D45D0|nr:ETC complex I subunit [Acetobacter estunensis]MBV1836270.1 ETC complex I subunit [Acetobacter estunensis]